MFFGVSIGIASAFMQSAAYIFSRRFVNHFHSSLKLVVYSQLLMGAFGVVVFAATFPFVEFPRGAELWKFAPATALFVVAYHVAFYCFFKALNEIEASRLSSLLGLKVVTIALITYPFLQSTLVHVFCLNSLCRFFATTANKNYFHNNFFKFFYKLVLFT